MSGRLLCILLSVLSGSLCFQVALATEIPASGVSKVLLVASEGKWSFKPSTSATVLKIDGADFDGLFSVTRKDDRLEIVDRREYLEAQKNRAQKEYQVLVPGHMGLEVHLGSGELIGVGLKGEGLLDVQNGKVAWSGAQGSWTIHLHKGDLDLTGNEARMTVDQYNGHCAIRSQQGDLQVSEFLGELVVDKAQGSLHLALGSGSAKVLNSGGNLVLDSAKANITVPQFAGPIDGSLQEGALNLVLSDESDVHVKSQAARIAISATPETGLSLNLFNSEGEINLPAPMRVGRDSSGKFYHGKWKGERTNMVRVQVRSQEGAITIR